jgi:hypothetical protein
MGTFVREVIEFNPPTRVAFRETLHWFGSAMAQARPEYSLEGDEIATVVHHVAVGELYGWMRFMKPGAAKLANLERTRTLKSLKRSWSLARRASPEPEAGVGCAFEPVRRSAGVPLHFFSSQDT